MDDCWERLEGDVGGEGAVLFVGVLTTDVTGD